MVRRTVARGLDVSRFPAWPDPLPVRQWMKGPAVTVGATAPAREADTLMTAHRVRHLPVVDEAGHLVGIVTDRDLRPLALRAARTADEAAADPVLVRDVMTWTVVTTRPEADLRDAARLMHDQKIGSLPVVERGVLVGILTETDLLAALQEVLRHRVRRPRPLTERPPGEPYDPGVAVPEPGSDESGGER
jgi:CBS domain-containing protein